MKRKYINPKVEVTTFASTNLTNLTVSNQAAPEGGASVSTLKSVSINDLNN